MTKIEFIKWADHANVDFEFYTECNSGVNGKVAFFEKGNKHNCYLIGNNNKKTNWEKFKNEIEKLI